MALPKTITYSIPPHLAKIAHTGKRAEVPLRDKLYSGIIIGYADKLNKLEKIRDIISILDDKPIISEKQIQFWNWIAQYYCTTIGEVMNIALPAGLKLSSETKLIFNPNSEEDFLGLTDKEYLIAEALSIRNELSINEVQEILDQKTVYPIIRKLLEQGILYIKEELKDRYKPKEEDFIHLIGPSSGALNADEYMDKVSRSNKQQRALLLIMQHSQSGNWIRKKEITNKADVDGTVIKALEKKGLINIEARRVSRINIQSIDNDKELPELSPAQTVALKEIKEEFKDKGKVLLFGLTGSGKTRIYIDLIKEYLDEGKQILYLIPEIALTTQLVSRLQKVFGEAIGVYHSKMNNSQRVELWNAAQSGKKLFVGARSGLFLPFSNLGLIIVDEEHDSSYKQSDPAPRYQARDSAIYLAGLFNAQILMGTATPSMETFQNTVEGKFGLVKILERFGNSILPDIKVVDLKSHYKKGLMRSVFSLDVLESIAEAIANNDQALIFQNRRGYAPTIHCKTCSWHAECPNCDVSLTVHKFHDELRCHYCGYRIKTVKDCPSCGNHDLDQMGFGTEKIEDELKKLLPNIRVARLDYDTAKTKNAFEGILEDFENGEIDVLVGTQMITKGLDFDRIAVVAILNADKMLYFPEFRANERAFQLLTQVAGRAGRREKQGKVIIQSFNPTHPVIRETVANDFEQFYTRELEERRKFIFPPYYRLIEITIKHKKFDVASEAGNVMSKLLRAKLGNRVSESVIPSIGRLRGFYIRKILIKLEKNNALIKKVKPFIKECKIKVLKMEKKASVRINIDVDP